MQDHLCDKENLGKRFPSFFQSPSLVNMDGLGVTDKNLHLDENDHNDFKSNNSHHHLEFKSGHQTSANIMHKSISGRSGLFVMDDDLSCTNESSTDSFNKNSDSDLR